MGQNHFDILVSKFTQLFLEFVHCVYCNSLVQFVPRIHHPRTEISIPPGLSFLVYKACIHCLSAVSCNHTAVLLV